jgi:hypothetical protein
MIREISMRRKCIRGEEMTTGISPIFLLSEDMPVREAKPEDYWQLTCRMKVWWSPRS